MKIEISTREYLISTIAKNGISEWTSELFGKLHRDSIKEIGTRIFESSRRGESPDFFDTYFHKLAKEGSKNTTILYHPFYYLTWTELTSLISKDFNYSLIKRDIGPHKAELLLTSLTTLNQIRNDVAHSRFISESDLSIVKSCTHAISTLIHVHNDNSHINIYDNSLKTMTSKIIEAIQEFRNTDLVSTTSLNETSESLARYINSFWMNIFYPDLVLLLQDFKSSITLYMEYRNRSGGLLNIIKWKESNIQLFDKIKDVLDGRQI